jgi:hypothetical protein
MLFGKQALLTRSKKKNKITGHDIQISGMVVHKTTAVAPHTFTPPVGSKGLRVTV